MLDSSWASSVGREKAVMAQAVPSQPSWDCRTEAPPFLPWPEPHSLSLSSSVMDLTWALIHTYPRPPWPSLRNLLDTSLNSHYSAF